MCTTCSYYPSCLDSVFENSASPYYTLSAAFGYAINMLMPLRCYAPANDEENQEHDDIVGTYIMGGEL